MKRTELKKYLHLIFLAAINLTLFAQNDTVPKFAFDHIVRSDLYILKTVSETKNPGKKAVSELTEIKEVEQLFGTNHKVNKYQAFLSSPGFTSIVYPDGLSINLPENPGNGIEFKITSNKYILYLSTGQEIKIGMKGDDLQKIFPASYSHPQVVTYQSPDKGKTYVRVYFSYLRNNKLLIEGNCIVFVLSKEDNILEQIRTYYPD